ncbi:hypothetical protein DFH11DRAFT_1658435 [Phellopilus nigrolimitatus]|nr:hypothetical protein DFH11DRAFT_1658435 [Phellopilus nigrolimitatus]
MADIPNFSGQGKVDDWIGAIDLHFEQNGIPENERLDFAMAHLIAPARDYVDSLANCLESKSGRTWVWTWMKLKAALRGIEKDISSCSTTDSHEQTLKKAVPNLLVGGASLFVGGITAALFPPLAVFCFFGAGKLGQGVVQVCSVAWKSHREGFEPSSQLVEELLSRFI